MGRRITGPFFKEESMILDVKNLKKTALFKRVPVKAGELGEGAEILIRELSGAQQAELQELIKNKADERDVTAFIFKASIIDEHDQQQLTTNEQALAFFDAVPARLVNRLSRAIWDLNKAETEKKS